MTSATSESREAKSIPTRIPLQNLSKSLTQKESLSLRTSMPGKVIESVLKRLILSEDQDPLFLLRVKLRHPNPSECTLFSSMIFLRWFSSITSSGMPILGLKESHHWLVNSWIAWSLSLSVASSGDLTERSQVVEIAPSLVFGFDCIEVYLQVKDKESYKTSLFRSWSYRSSSVGSCSFWFFKNASSSGLSSREEGSVTLEGHRRTGVEENNCQGIIVVFFFSCQVCQKSYKVKPNPGMSA